MHYDVIIVGGGVAGLSAALWCDELGLSGLLLERRKEFGGQLALIHNKIENYLGRTSNNGRDFLEVILKQTDKRNFTSVLGVDVQFIDTQNRKVALDDGREFSAASIIVATGVRRRKLHIAGEDIFKNKGILRSGNLDSDKVAGKTVVIVGGGDAAIENALILAKRSAKIYVINRGTDLRARTEFIDQVNQFNNIEILFESVIRRINGSEKVESVEIEDTKTNIIRSLDAEAVLIRIGVQPNNELVRETLELDEGGYILINDICETNVEGIYAIGDISNPISPTISSASGAGATAIKHIHFLLST